MTHLIDKDVLVTEIEKKRDAALTRQRNLEAIGQVTVLNELIANELNRIITFINTLEVKEVGDNSLEKFKSLQHITQDLRQTIEDWGYAPNLYFFDGMWHVSWISCEEGDGIKDFEGNTPEDAIDKAYDWFHSTFCNS